MLTKIRKKIDLTFKEIIWIFLFTCFLGFIVEILFCLVWHGKLENRQGLLYGPFTPIYGFGALAMCFTLLPLSGRNPFLTFLTSGITGGVVEFVGSYVEQLLFGSRSWKFTNYFLDIDGRTSLLMMMAWGALGTIFIQWIFPFLRWLIKKIRISQNSVVCGLLLVFFLFNFAVSGLEINRWIERLEGARADTRIDLFLDDTYPNDVMETIFPKLKPASD